MNIAVFMDEVMPINGPLMPIPRSHKHGVLSAGHDEETTSYPLWTLDKETVIKLVQEGDTRGPRSSHRAPRPAPIPGSRSLSRRPVVRRPALPMRARRSPLESTSSWSMSKPMCWPGRCWPEARARGVVYSLAYGDQPALACDLVDWARACGFEVVAAGNGTKYLPAYHAVTPEDVWEHYGLTPEAARRSGMNPQMFNSFLDGTKSAIEMAAIANACGLSVPCDGLAFPPCGVDDLPQVLRATAAGGVLERDGMVEVVSSLERDGRPVFRDLRWGVYVVLKAPNDYARACFKEYGLKTDPSGWYAAMYKPYHLIGLELGVSVLSAVLRDEPTGQPCGFRGDVVAIAKRALRAGETLDGEGGYRVWGRLVPAERSLAEGVLPIGLAHKVPLQRDIAACEIVRWADVAAPDTEAVRVRRDMERRFAPPSAIAAQ